METILFIGDSVTDCGQREGKGRDGLGDGYVAEIAARLATAHPGAKVLNRGISGNRIRDLVARWQPDVTDLSPTVLTILIGINDVWRTFDRNDPIDQRRFAEEYRQVLAQVQPGVRLIMMEPFVLPIPDDRKAWRVELDPAIDTVRSLAFEFGAELVPLDGLLTAEALRRGMATLAEDGVHPTAEGHRFIADKWMEAFTAGAPAKG